jgi:hypothetical protein
VFRLCSLVLLLTITAANAASLPSFDRQLALDVGRAYVESYVRWHPDTPHSFDWSTERVEFIEYRDREIVGYVAVSIPSNATGGGGVAYFEVQDVNPGHMIVFEWGYHANLAKELERFRSAAASGLIPH